jgi:O-antigen/teichoic acid export membrane protein
MLTATTSILARFAGMGVSLVTIPLTLHYLGNERFGLWMTISSVLAMASFADFGIGNGVLNTVATAFGKDDLEGLRQAISSGMAVLLLIGATVLSAFFVAYPFVPWGSLFRVSSSVARAEAGPAMMSFAVCFALNIPLDVVQRVQLGLQEGFRTNVWQVCASVAGLLGLLLAMHLRLGLPGLVLIFAGVPVLGTALNALHFFGFSRPDLLPTHRYVYRKLIAQITRLGGLFFVLQVVAAISYSADNFIIAHVLGAEGVATFSIPQRMFSLVTLPVTMFLVPFWPAYAEAVSRGDHLWIKRTLFRTLFGVLLFASVASAVVLAASNRLILWWIGPQIHPPFVLLLGFAIWTVMSCYANTLGVFLNGVSVIRFQVITASIFGVSCLAAKIFFSRHYGISAVPWATILTCGAFSLLPSTLYIPRLLERIETKPVPLVVDAAG